MLFLLALTSLVVGVMIGALGVGGILLIPAIAAFAGLDIHTAMGTALFTFIFTGIIGTLLYHRLGSVDWRLALPICLGAVAFAWLGALANAHADASGLKLGLALVILFAGLHIVKPVGRTRPGARGSDTPGSRTLLMCIGSGVGFGSGLTGVGGPILSIPIMVAIGFDPLASVAAGQVLQIAAAASGAVGNLAYGRVDFGLAAWVTLLELVGVWAGVRLSHSLPRERLKACVATVCILLGGFMAVQSLLAWL